MVEAPDIDAVRLLALPAGVQVQIQAVQGPWALVTWDVEQGQVQGWVSLPWLAVNGEIPAWMVTPEPETPEPVTEP